MISDEAHRTQAGRLARNMRLALPNAAFIGFTGTPLLDSGRAHQTHLRRLCLSIRFQAVRGGRRDRQTGLREPGGEAGCGADGFERSHCRKDRRGRARSRPGGSIGKAARVRITKSSPRTNGLTRLRIDFVEHCATRWESGKSMLVCIDKITCARMLQLIVPRWQAKAVSVKVSGRGETYAQAQTEPVTRPVAPRWRAEAQQLAAQADLARRDHRRDHHQRGAKRGQRLREMGL